MRNFMQFMEAKINGRVFPDRYLKDYYTGWDEIVPAFQNWTRTDKTPKEWAVEMLGKLKAMETAPGTTINAVCRIYGTQDALSKFIKDGKVDHIGTTGHITTNPDASPPFSPN